MKNKFYNAFRGLYHVIAKDDSVRIQLWIGLGVLVAAALVCVSRMDWIVLILAIGLVLSSEVLNSSLEHIGDLPSRRKHPAIGRGKDIAAGAVFISAVIAAIVGIIVFFPYILAGEAGICWMKDYMV